MKIVALCIFLLTYILLLSLPKFRAYVAIAAAAVFVILGILPVSDAFAAVDWNVIMMIAGTMGTVSLLIDSRMPARLADIIMGWASNVKWVIVLLSLFSGIISAFVDNVATVLMVAPVALAICRKLGMSPVPVIIAISVSSNLQGAATLVGDTTSILLGGHIGMDFMDFFFFRGKVSLFWVVELGALASALILLWLFRGENRKVDSMSLTPVEDYFPSVLMILTVVLLIAASFIPGKPSVTNGVICMTLFLIGLIRDMIRKKDFSPARKHLAEVDLTTLLLLAGLFVVIAGIQRVGLIDDISRLFVSLASDNLFLIYTLLVWASVIISAFIDNIPYVATMLPVVSGIASMMGVEPYILHFGMIIGATLGGNLTPVGASANIAGIGILRKEGYEVSVAEFSRIGVPFTLTAVCTGYLLIWLIWA